MSITAMRKIVAACAAWVATAVAAPAIWNGSADISWYESSAQAYNLTTAEQLAGLAKLVNQGTSSFEGKTITLGADIFLNDTAGAEAGTWASVPHTEWTPIGTSSRPFKGEFDGIAGKKNRKIYGLYINNATKDYVGLFGYTNNVKVSNLDILVGKITAKDNVGTLIGYADSGSVTNVHGEIRVTGNNHVGGLVGYFTGTLSTSSVKENVTGQDSVGGLIGFTTGAISGTAKTKSSVVGNVTGRKYVGGIVGAGSSITQSYTEGTVKGDSSYVGGIAGYAAGAINSVYHIGGDVIGLGHYVGGVVGYGSTISKSYAEGTVRGDSNYVGGIAGYAAGTINSVYHVGGDVIGLRHYVGGVVGYGSTISKSYAEGTVKGDSNYVGGVAGYVGGAIDSVHHVDGNVNGYNYVGGVAGCMGQSVINSYSEAKVVGKDYIGGLIGLAVRRVHAGAQSDADDDTYIKMSYSVGDVKGNRYVGGLIGGDSLYKILENRKCVKWQTNGKITKCVEYLNDNNYSTKIVRTIISTSSKGNVEGYTYVGGLIGAQSVGSDSSNKYVSSRYLAFNILNSNHGDGAVSGGGSYIGGLIGLSKGRISNAYHINGDVSGFKFVGGLVGQADSTVTSSYSEGNVTGRNDYVGGLIGSGVFVDSSNHAQGNVSGSNYVGGLIGETSSSVRNSHSEGNVTGVGDYVGGLIGSGVSVDFSNHTKGNVSGSNYVGGLIGEASSSVRSSYSEGNVTGTGNYIGGLIGLFLRSVNTTGRSKADSSYIRDSYSIGNVKGVQYVGGLVGIDSIYKLLTKNTNNNYYNESYYSKPIVRIVSHSSSKGRVEGTIFVGGLVGSQAVGSDSSNKYVSNSYFSYKVLSCNHDGGDVSADSNYVGGLIGYARGTVDSSFHVGGNVNGSNWVGGLIGQISSSVRNSYSEGNVTGIGNFVGGLIGAGDSVDSSFHVNGDVGGSSYVGGLIGRASSVRNSYSEGNVTGIGSYVGGLIGIGYSGVDSSFHVNGDVGGSSYVGGLIGQVSSSVKNSYSEGNVTGENNYVGGLIGSGVSVDSSFHVNGDVGGSSYVGGLIGQASSSVNYSHSEGSVLGNADYVGGLAGSASVIRNSYAVTGFVKGRNRVGAIAGSASGKISNSYAESKYVKGQNFVGGLAGFGGDSIEVSSFEGDSITGVYQIGGLVGYAKSAVDSSYSTAHVKGDDNVGGLIGSAYGDVSNSYAIGNVVGDVEHSSAGNDNLGGLVGYQYSGSVSKSMALGNVSGTTKLGGLVGRFDGTMISQSYANGDVAGDYYGDPADEVGNYYIGGLVGYAKGSLQETYASGIVKGIEDEPVYTGCVVGYVNGSLSISKTYYDKAKCGLGIDGGEETATVSGSPDKTTAEMQTQETFVGWDFANTWKIKENTYPFLQIYSNSLTNAVVTTASLEGIVFDGTAKTPLVTSVTLFGESLEYETEYTIAYKDNINAGTATINVCGVKPYGGCKIIEFEIARITIEPTIAVIDNMVYTGLPLTPEIKVYNGKTLLAVTDYVVEYKDNENTGTATVSVTMKGNYSGSASKTFTIEKATPVISQNPTASGVVLGQTLVASELSGGRTNVDGEFVWKAPTVKPELENEGYAVVFVPTDTNYTKSAEIIVPVKVLDLVYVAVHIGGNTLDSIMLVRGTNYTLPNEPDSIGYDFVGLYHGESIVGNAGDQIVVSENTVIDAVYKVKTFVITFKNGSTVLQSSEVAYGVIPTAPMVTLPENTAQYTYSFEGWDKEIVAVTEAAIYVAVIDSVVNKYKIVFKNYDETELKDSSYEYGTIAAKIAKPADPIHEASAQYSYIFKSWTPTVSDVTEDAVYTAVFDSIVNAYMITFVNKYDTLQSVKNEMEYGSIPVYEGTPTRESTAQYIYTFKEWTPEIVAVSEAATYTAVFDSSVQSYVVTFVNDAEELQSSEIEYGVLPKYVGTVPTKMATAQYTYSFKGWIPAIAEVTGPVAYKAIFDSTVNEYEIIFVNGSTVLQSSDVGYGSMPTAPAVTLPKNTAQYTYSFRGWDKEIVPVTWNATYTAVIDSVVNEYEIVFKDYDGTILKEAALYDYGTAVSDIARPSNPIRGNTAQYSYAFKTWSPAITEVTEDAVYTAEYDSTIRSYTITFANDNEVLQSSAFDYGEKPTYDGVVPTKPATDRCSYTFKEWSPSIMTVSRDATYKAVFDCVVNSYTITFRNGSTILQNTEVAYGSTPTAPSVMLPKNTAQYTYSFRGWDKEIIPVTGNETYSAIIDSVVNEYEVVFKDYDGTALEETALYDYGTASSDIAKPSNPTRGNTAQYSYTFKTWSPAITEVTEDAVYTAEYDSTIRCYTITFANDNEVLQSSAFDYGEKPTYDGVVPTKSATDRNSYTFKGWNPSITTVTRDATYKAVFDSVVNSYIVAFKNGPTILQSTNVVYGSMPTAPAVTLPKDTAQYTYSFRGWDKEIVPVTGNATYTAVIDSVVNKYEVSFKNYDGTLIKTSTYAYGSTVVKPVDPTRAATAKFTYTFKGWTPTVASVTADAVYKAVFDSVAQDYAIVFVSGSDTLQLSSENYDSKPSYKGETPVKEATAQYEYTFKGWNPSIASVSGDAIYKAVFDSTVKKYAVTFVSDDKMLQTSSVAYGSIPKYTGVTPTKASTKNYSYEFTGWSPKIEKVVGEVTYKAVFDSTKLTGIMDGLFANLEMSVSAASRNIQISAAPVGSTYAILDMQGRVLKKGYVESANFNIAMPCAGNYLVRIGGRTKRVNVK